MTASMTSGQKKQLKRLFEDGADWALGIVEKELDQEEVQRVLGRGDELRAGFPELIRILTRGRYASEVVPSSYTYSPKFTGLKPVRDQVEVLMKHFPNLDPTWALEQGQQWYDGLKPDLPDWVEGPLVYAWQRGVNYHSALQAVLDKLVTTRALHNYCEGRIDHKHLRQSKLTQTMERKLRKLQPGDFLIVPSQLGKRYAGSSVRRARELFIPGELGLSSLAVSCLALTHPERFVDWKQLHIDCVGDEFSLDANGVFARAPYIRLSVLGLEFGVDVVFYANDGFGSMSAFLPQKLQLEL